MFDLHRAAGTWVKTRMGGCQNCGPLLGPLNTRCRIMIRMQKGTIIFKTIHMERNVDVLENDTPLVLCKLEFDAPQISCVDH